jgi:hypothetical protein
MLFSGLSGSGSSIVRVEYRQSTGTGQIRAVVSRRAGTSTTGWLAIAAGGHVIELAWVSATSGSTDLWLDGLRTSVTGVDTSVYRLETVRLGPSAGLATGMTGTVSVDRFVSSLGSAIGP